MSSPAKITRFAAVAPPTQVKANEITGASRPLADADETEENPGSPAVAAETLAIPEVKITIEEQREVEPVPAEAEDRADIPELHVTIEEPISKPGVQLAFEEPGGLPDIPVVAEEPVEVPELLVSVEESGELPEIQVAAEAPDLPKPAAVQAQIHEVLKSSKPSVSPGPVPAVAVPAFQPVTTAQAAAFGQPGSEWAAAAAPSPGVAHPGSGLSAVQSPYSAAFQPIGLSGRGTDYTSTPQFPAGVQTYPTSSQASSPVAWGSPGPPKNGQAEATHPAVGAISPPASAFGSAATPDWPRNGGDAVPPHGGTAVLGQPAVHGRRPVQGPAVSTASAVPDRSEERIADQPDGGLIIRLLKRVPLAVWIAAALAFILGGMAGAKINSIGGQAEIQNLQTAVSQARQQAQVQKDARVEGLKKERQRLQEDLLRVASYSLDYPEGSIPRALAQAATEEFKIADTLLLQQIAALESGAKVTVSVKQTRPDPELAATLEAEMIKLEEEIARQWQEAKDLEETPKMLATTSISTQLVSLAILNRNLLIARYGLSSPVPLQYRSPAPQSPARAEVAAPPTPQFGSTPESDNQNQAEMERLKKENEQLRAESEMLLTSDSTLYASAVSDLGSGQLASAEEKYTRLLQMFPTSPLAPRATEGLAEIKVKAAEKEAAKNPPLEIMATGVKHDGGYFRNQTYVRVSFKNISQLMIKRVEFKILTFDEHGYPIASKRLDITQDNFFNAAMTENIAPGRSDYGVWELSEKVRQVKVKLKAVEFYDAPPWRDEDIELWVEKESGRYLINGGEALKPAPGSKAPAKKRR